MKTTTLLVTVMALTTATWAQTTPSKPDDTGKKVIAPQGPAASTTSSQRQAVPAADDIATWAKPLYRTTKGQEKTIVEVQRFPYREETYVSTKPIEYLSKDQYRYVTPEDAVVSRLSAMANLDYEGWLRSWDSVSQARLKEMDARNEPGVKKRLNQWQGVFSQVRPVLVRRIETGKYVIVTYKLLNKAGQDAGMFEFPTPFRQDSGLWIGTDALKDDAMFNLVPWVTGHLSDEKDFRPLSETVIK